MPLARWFCTHYCFCHDLSETQGEQCRPPMGFGRPPLLRSVPDFHLPVQVKKEGRTTETLRWSVAALCYTKYQHPGMGSLGRKMKGSLQPSSECSDAEKARPHSGVPGSSGSPQQHHNGALWDRTKPTCHILPSDVHSGF